MERTSFFLFLYDLPSAFLSSSFFLLPAILKPKFFREAKWSELDSCGQINTMCLQHVLNYGLFFFSSLGSFSYVLFCYPSVYSLIAIVLLTRPCSFSWIPVLLIDAVCQLFFIFLFKNHIFLSYSFPQSAFMPNILTTIYFVFTNTSPVINPAIK